jgi:hypothetical protein
MHTANHLADRERPFSLIWHAASERVIGSLREDRARACTTSEARLQRDVAAFQTVLFDVHKHARDAGVVFNLDFLALSDAATNKHYLFELRQSPARLLPFLTPRLIGVPGDAGPFTIEARVHQLQTLFRRVIVEVPADARPAQFKSLTNVTLAIRWGTAAARDVITFADRARQVGLPVMISGVDEPEALAVAHESEFDLISGPSIGLVDHIAPRQRDLRLADILSRQTAA